MGLTTIHPLEITETVDRRFSIVFHGLIVLDRLCGWQKDLSGRLKLKNHEIVNRIMAFNLYQSPYQSLCQSLWNNSWPTNKQNNKQLKKQGKWKMSAQGKADISVCRPYMDEAICL